MTRLSAGLLATRAYLSSEQARLGERLQVQYHIDES